MDLPDLKKGLRLLRDLLSVQVAKRNQNKLEK